ncbi:cobaltochelatase subunit CobN [Pseudoduganella buxea]|uniref:Cobalamin biosynthesis protein CobN n=1 Tax=Pseudoduganella buxea TaxID=1949069 RepID=A0A6I3SXW6_9BURK|nr:cobaltochelatase subunit CobN [Pseudoduganella buxea]MTV53112.1 cobaltochelatase subunit CobN [Pseudoduganella buxea]GGB85097.1 cobalamin biosynthesis protein CobN [Pseudoduganella buxea]
MCRNKLHCWLFALCALLASLGAQAQTRTLALLLGDVESRPAVLAARELGAELNAARVAVRIIPASGMTAGDHAALASADVAIVNVKGSQLVQAIAPELETLRRRGATVLAVGATPDDAQRALGFTVDTAVQAYHREGGVENAAGLLRHVLVQSFGANVTVPPVQAMPEHGLYDVAANRSAASFDDFVAHYARHRPGAPWIGVMFYRSNLVAGQTLPLAAIVARLEQSGYNVLPAYGYPYDVPLRLFLDGAGRSRIELLVALGMKVGGTAATAGLLERIGVPAINAITLSQHSAAQWEASKTGLDLMERTWQMAGAEIAGLIQPTVVASRENVRDKATGLVYVEEQPIAGRIERLNARVAAWLALRRTPNGEKKIAILYYNYPHGSGTIGAAYLNVLPESLWQIGARLQAVGYRFGVHYPATPAALQAEIQQWGNYPGKGGKEYLAGLARLARSGEALLVPLADYRRWYDALPAALRTAVEAAWGKPETSPVLWRDTHGVPHFVFPARRHGNVLLAPQPGRAWEQNLAKLHNDVSLPPGHEYIAFYLWLQHGYGAGAVLHVGTHGTQEWLTGKEAGLSESDATEALIGAMPNIYPYVMDDVGEGLQAKRRGMATIIDHMTPPFDAAGLNPDLRELGALLNDYRVAGQKSPLLVKAHLAALNALAAKAGVLKDMGRKGLTTEADMEALEEYLDDTGARLTPFGLHTFGVAPPAALRNATARAVVSLDTSVAPDRQAARTAQLEDDIVASAEAELARLVQALDGKFIQTGPSADLLRNPGALPTGRNFFGLDPSRIPSRAVYEQGSNLATSLVTDYRRRHGTWPDRITMNLWGVETSRHEGVMEAQAMALMGVKPTWDERGRVTGVEAIGRRALGRPRVDVTMVSSGLFRDLFGNLLALLDQATQLAQAQDDGGENGSDNPLRARTQATAGALRTAGLDADTAVRLAGVRIFGLPSGAYGTNIEKLIPLTNAWQDEKQVADVFVNRMSHPFGNGYWGDDAADPAQRRALFRQALSGSKIALHSRSSNLFATLDNDDFFQYLGGTAMAIRSVDGKTPDVIVSDLSNARRPGHKTLAQYMGQEMQSRYLNPRWADTMLKEGYSGARFINRVVDYLWAWQVTVPEVVDNGTWQRMYDTYVADRHGLKVRERIAAGGNLRAYQAITDRMLSAIERGYWQPSREVRDTLEAQNDAAIAQAGVACSADSCSRATLRSAPLLAPGPAGQGGAPADTVTEAVAVKAAPVAGTAPLVPTQAQAQPAPAQASTAVSGFQMEAIEHMTPVQKTIGALVLLALAAVLVGLGYWWRRGTAARLQADL